MMTQPSGTTATSNNSPIVAEETGVATSYEATKNITCGDVEWHVSWKSGPAKGSVRGDITVSVAGKSKALAEAQAQVFGKFASVDTVSATCNKGADGKPTRSSLLVSGNSLENGKKSLAQLHVDPGLKVEWSFDPAE